MERGEIAPEEQFLLLSTIFSYLMLDFYVKTRIRFSLRNKWLFEITDVEITRVDCNSTVQHYIHCEYIKLTGLDIWYLDSEKCCIVYMYVKQTSFHHIS